MRERCRYRTAVHDKDHTGSSQAKRGFTYFSCAMTARPQVPSSLATVLAKATLRCMEGSESSSRPTRCAMTSVSVSDLKRQTRRKRRVRMGGGGRANQAKPKYRKISESGKANKLNRHDKKTEKKTFHRHHSRPRVWTGNSR